MGLSQYTISLIFISMFAIAIISFGIGFGNDNSTTINLKNDPELNLLDQNTKGNLSAFKSGSEQTYESIVESSTTGETTPSGGQFAITPLNAVGATTNILKVGWIKIFGSGSGFGFFLYTFLSIMTFLLGIYVWKAWIGRNPE